MSPAGRRSMGVYQPRSRRAAFADALAEARRKVSHALRTTLLRGAGAIVFLAAVAGLVALATYSPHDASWNNATLREPSNLLGGLGATAADLLLQTFGIAAPALWGVRAMSGKSLRYAIWRAAAWLPGTIFIAAAFGALPSLQALPAGAGGLTGIAAARFAAHEAAQYGLPWLTLALPGLFLVAGLPLAFLATGLRFKPV